MRKLPATDNTSIIAGNIKPSEDGSGVIVRMFESEGKRAEIQLPPGKWYAADMLEQNYEPVAGKIIFKPFEIKTLLSIVSDK